MAKTEIVTLDWKGPIRLGHRPSKGLVDTARKYGVYAFHYPLNAGMKEGIYFGSAKKSRILDRIFDHIGNHMSGLDNSYDIHSTESKPAYTNKQRETDYFEYVHHLFAQLLDIRIYVAQTDEECARFVERELIVAYQKIQMSGDRYFPVQDLHATRTAPSTLAIRNTGNVGFLPKAMRSGISSA